GIDGHRAGRDALAEARLPPAAAVLLEGQVLPARALVVDVLDAALQAEAGRALARVVGRPVLVAAVLHALHGDRALGGREVAGGVLGPPDDLEVGILLDGDPHLGPLDGVGVQQVLAPRVAALAQPHRAAHEVADAEVLDHVARLQRPRIPRDLVAGRERVPWDGRGG